MSQDHNAMETITKLTIEQVAEFLRINPEFFEKNPDILAEMQIPHLAGEGTTSLIERQVQVLREQNDMLQDQLKTFAVLASENEELWLRFKDLAVVLVKSRFKDNLSDSLESWLKSEYSLSGVVINTESKKQFKQNLPKQKIVQKLLEDKKIQCGTDFPEELLKRLFKKDAEMVKSCALIPLNNSKAEYCGLLALGSDNTERFSNQQATAYLDCLSQLISQALFQA